MKLKPVVPPVRCPYCKDKTGVLFSVDVSRLESAIGVEKYQCDRCKAIVVVNRQSEGKE